MQCSNCGFENPVGMRFCGQCGTSLGWRCSTCGASNPADADVCAACGAPAKARPPPEPSPVPPRSSRSAPLAVPDPPPSDETVSRGAERRQITVLFCDLVGSTDLSARLDPEEFRELLQSYQQSAAQAVERFGGYIAQYLGDGILAYFGYPVAYDAEAARAVRAALEIIERIRARNAARSGSPPLAVRIGVHSGVVVISEVGGGSRREHLALGEVPNIAARLQGLAPPDGVVLSETSYRLVAGEFRSEDLGPQLIRGLPRPERIYRVLGESATYEPAVAPNGVDVSALVGREHELSLLAERWREAKTGRGQVVVISGDPGIGKSRLARAFLAGLAGDEVLLLQGRCLPYYQNTPYYPILDMLRRRLDFVPEQSAQERLAALKAMLERDGHLTPETLRVLAGLLSLTDPDPLEPEPESAARSRDRTRPALLRMFAGCARAQPLVVLLEDLHWADPSTLDLFHRLMEEAASQAMIVLLTHRPEFRPPWRGAPHLLQLPLARLERPEVETIVERLAEHRRLPPPVLEQIVERTDGVPLFVEELTKMVLETGLLEERGDHYELKGPLPPLAIPTSLHDSLEARLDRLATTKELAQIGAAIGREFSYDLIQAVTGLAEPMLRSALVQLVEAELLHQRGEPPQAVYSFKHALIQEAAYQSLLRSARQKHHLRIAQVLESRFPELVATEPERLAQHYMGAGLTEQAFVYWLKAGSRAVKRSANHEAVAHFDHAREALDALPDTPKRAQRELALQLALGPALVATRGYTAPEVRAVYLSATALSSQVGDCECSFRAVCGLFSSHLVHLELDEAIRQAERLTELAAQTGKSSHQLIARVTMGAALVELGRSRQGREHLEAGLRLYDSGEHFPLTFMIGQDFGVVTLGYLSHALWHCGLPAQALARIREALELAVRLDHPHTLAFALAFGATQHYLRREPEPLVELTEQLLALAQREGFQHWLLHASALGGWAQVQLGEEERGLALLSLIADAQRSGGVQPAYYRRIHALGLERAGRIEEALRVVEQGWPSCDGACTWRMADLFGIRGALLARVPGREAEAEEWLQRSLRIATELEALSLQLRAATGLARLLGGTERGGEARRFLAEIYGAFEEGFELADLQDARDLLHEAPLASAPGSGAITARS